MTATSKLFVQTLLRGVAQLAFCDRSMAGALILAGLALISPWGAAGALAGAAFGTAMGVFGWVYPREEWERGLAGFNTAIIGILWGGFFADGAFEVSLFVTVMSLCVALEFVLRRGLALVSLPALSMPAMVTAMVVSWALAAPGTWFWIETPSSPLGIPGALLGALCIVAAMAMKCGLAAAWSLCLGSIAYMSVSQEGNGLAYSGLWALTVPLAFFAMQAVFLRESLAGTLGGMIAALSAGIIWLFWTTSGAADIAPPLLAPLALGLWLSIAAMRRIRHALLLQPNFWRAALTMHRARAAGRPIMAVLGGDSAKYALALESLSGGRRGERAKPPAFSHDRLRASLRLRKAFWEVCDRLRASAQEMEAKAQHHALARFEGRGWVRKILSRDVLGTLRKAGAKEVADVHGRIDRIACLDCGFNDGWPPGRIWRRCDLRCPDCSGALIPDTNLFHDAMACEDRLAIERDLADCAVLLVLGAQERDEWSDFILDTVRGIGGHIVFVTDEVSSHLPGSDDMVLAATPEAALPYLDAVSVMLRLMPDGGTLGRWPRWCD